MNRTLAASIVGILAAGGVVVGVLSGGDDGTNKGPVAEATKAAELVQVVLPEACPQQGAAEYDSRAAQCPGGMTTSPTGRCICLADSAALPAERIDPAVAERAMKQKLLRCPTGLRWVPAPAAVPAQCVDLSGDILEPVTGPVGNGIETEFDRAMKARCAPYPVFPGDHGHCPECTTWPGGCPPCREIATRYGSAWQGHEAECHTEATP